MRCAGLLSSDRTSASQMSVAPRAASMTTAAGSRRESGSTGSIIATTSASGRTLPSYDHLTHHNPVDSRGPSASGAHMGEASPSRHLQQQQPGRQGLAVSVAPVSAQEPPVFVASSGLDYAPCCATQDVLAAVLCSCACRMGIEFMRVHLVIW